MTRSRTIALLALLFSAQLAAQQEDALVVTSWGGAYEESQRTAYIDSFEQATGIAVMGLPYSGGIESLETPGEITWDVLDMVKPDALLACERGLLRELDPGILADAPDGTPAQEDFREGAVSRCGIEHLTYATVLAYDESAFPGFKPGSVKDFFDVEQFPGKRALQREPIAIFEWALYAQDIPRSQIYDLLSTERGVSLALRKLEEIRDHLVWWDTGSEPVALLASGEVAMASGFLGRFFAARVNDALPLSVIQDGQYLDSSIWTINRDSRNVEAAKRFIRHVTSTESMAAFAGLLPYGPSRKSALRQVGLHATTNTPMMDHLPTSSRNLETSIVASAEWYSHTAEFRNRRFSQWLADAP